MSQTIQKLVRAGFTEQQAATLEETYPEIARGDRGKIRGFSWESSNPLAIHPYYFFHGFAGDQTLGDSLFFDKAIGNHGVRGANLTDTAMFANDGYVTTAAPSNPYDTCIRLPNLNYDWAGGELFFVFWRGIAATPAAETAIMGDGTATTTGNHGIQIRATTTGKVYLALFGADGGKVSANSNATVFDGTPHDFAFFMDGQGKNYLMYVDGALDTVLSGGQFLPFQQAYILDTLNSNTFNLGAAAKAPGTATLPQAGGVLKTRTLAILRMPNTYPVPPVSAVTKACKSLRTNPTKLLLASDL